MKKLLLIAGFIVFLLSLACACDYEGVLCGSSANGQNAPADTSAVKGEK